MKVKKIKQKATTTKILRVHLAQSGCSELAKKSSVSHRSCGGDQGGDVNK